MSWRTRHIRKRNKGKDKRRATKRSKQIGGGVSVEKLKDIITHLIETNENVSATIGKVIVTIKFISDNEFTGVINGINGTFEFTLKRNLMLSGDIIVNKNGDSDNAKITGQKVVIDNLESLEKIALSNKKNKEIKEKADLKMKEEEDAAARKKAIAENESAIKTQEIKDTYDVSDIDLGIFMIKVPVEGETQPYLEPVLEHLSYCVEKYFMGAITIKEVKAFLELFQNTNPHIGEKPKITPDEVKNKLQLAIDMISSIKNMLGIKIYSNSSIKNELIEILKRLKAKKIEPSNKYSFDKECKMAVTSDEITCFFMSCIKYFKLKGAMLDADTSISDIVANGTLTGYNNLLFVSDEKNVESYLGCACYKSEVYDTNYKSKVYKTNYMDIKISKILKNEQSKSEHTSEINKLIDNLKNKIKNNIGVIMHSMHIPNSLNEYVDKETNEIENEGDDFTTWVMIPTESNIQTKRIFEDVSQKITNNLIDVLTKITTLYSSTGKQQEEVVTTEVVPTEVIAPTQQQEVAPTQQEVAPTEVAPTQQEEVAQIGGSIISIDLQKHTELQEVDEMIKSLPAYVYNKNASLIEDAIGQINKSSETPDISSSIKTIINKITRDSSAIKATLKIDPMKNLLPEIVKEEEEFQKNASNTGEVQGVEEASTNTEGVVPSEVKSDEESGEVKSNEEPGEVKQDDAINPVENTTSEMTNENKIKIKDLLTSLLKKLEEKYIISTNQIGGSLSSILDAVLQKHPELNNTNIKQLFENIPDDVVIELNVEEILKNVSESDVKVELTDPFITELTTDISLTNKLVDNSKKDESTTLSESSSDATSPIEPTNESATDIIPNNESSPSETSVAEMPISEMPVAVTSSPSEMPVAVTSSPSEMPVAVTPEMPISETPVSKTLDATTETTVKEEDKPLSLDDLKISPTIVNKASNESGKYIFVPENMVQLVIDYLLSNGCEITTTVIKK